MKYTKEDIQVIASISRQLFTAAIAELAPKVRSQIDARVLDGLARECFRMATAYWKHEKSEISEIWRSGEVVESAMEAAARESEYKQILQALGGTGNEPSKLQWVLDEIEKLKACDCGHKPASHPNGGACNLSTCGCKRYEHNAFANASVCNDASCAKCKSGEPCQ